MSHRPLSLQLYSVRTAISADLSGTLARVSALNLKHVELYGFADRGAEYADQLAAHNLAAPSGHGSLVGDTTTIFDAANLIGMKTVIDPFIDPSRWTTRDDVAAIAAQLNAVALVAADSGLRIGYHNHAFELENRIGGVSALEVLADHLDDAVVLELDTYWVSVGGDDPVALLGKLGSRVEFLHIKDGPITKNDADQVAVGSGSMPISDILAAAPNALAVIELDDFTGDVFDAVRDSVSYLTELENS